MLKDVYVTKSDGQVFVIRNVDFREGVAVLTEEQKNYLFLQTNNLQNFEFMSVDFDDSLCNSQN